MNFFSVIVMCHHLDSMRSNQFAKRRTKIMIGDNSASFQVMHCEGGGVWLQLVELHDGDDIEMEVQRLHNQIDYRVRYDKIIAETDWLYPLPF